MQPASQSDAPAAFWDVARGSVVIVFAFLTASFPARHADVWRHLAAGRALFAGDYRFGTDPFADTTEGAVWVNHGWLFDAASYSLHHVLGGAALVVAKALLIALLAVVMLHLCWRGPKRWLAMIIIVAALAAIGPYALLRPVCLSLVFLGITYAWLERNPAPSWQTSAALLLMFALWANVDEWFFLGPVLVALWGFGTLVSRTPQPNNAAACGNQRNGPLLLIAVMGLVVALLNPHHVRVYSFPSLLDPSIAAQSMENADDRAARESPLEYLRDPATLQQAARWAYGSLILVGLLSFTARGRCVSPARVVVWLAFLLLSVYRCGAIPFFAVVGGPLAALNFQEWWAARTSAESLSRRSRLFVGLVQVLSLVLFAGAAVCAWAGWTRTLPGEPPRWTLEMNPSLTAAARQIAEWRAEEKWDKDARLLPTSSAAAAALAWWTPGAKSFCDDRPNLFSADVRRDFAAMRQALFGVSNDPQELQQWRDLLAKYRFTHLIVDDAEDDRLVQGLGRLFASSQWALHHVKGRTTIFGKRGPTALHLVDWRARAYATTTEKAPAAPPARDPEPRLWIDAFDRPLPSIEPDRDSCLVDQAYFDSQRSLTTRQLLVQWENCLASSMVGLPTAEMTLPGFPLGSLVRGACLVHGRSVGRAAETAPLYRLSAQMLHRYLNRHDDGPPGALWLAIRAGRRSLAKNLDDARAHRYLGEAYLRLRRLTRERAVLPIIQPLEHVRRVQVLTALRHAVRLDPAGLAGHELLAGFYLEIDYYDLALEHVQAVVQQLTRRGSAGDSPDQFRRRLEYWQQQETQLARQVRDAQLAVRSQTLEPYDRAILALNQRLPGLALTLLLEADAVSRGRNGNLVMLDLLLQTGGTHLVRTVLSEVAAMPKEDQEVYRWLKVYFAAATGDYAAADRELGDILGPVDVDIPEVRGRRVDPRVAMGIVLGGHVLDRAARLPYNPIPGVLQRAEGFALHLKQLAEIAALQGLLALEAGDTALARGHLRRSLQFFDDAEGAGGLARHYLGMMRANEAPR